MSILCKDDHIHHFTVSLFFFYGENICSVSKRQVQWTLEQHRFELHGSASIHAVFSINSPLDPCISPTPADSGQKQYFQSMVENALMWRADHAWFSAILYEGLSILGVWYPGGVWNPCGYGGMTVVKFGDSKLYVDF